MFAQAMPTPIVIADNDSLRECVQQWAAAPAIALDTEFMRTDTFYPKFALLQLCDGENVWLIDPLGVDDVEPIKALLLNPDVVKVLHSCSEDLEVLQMAFGCLPVALYDTQVAAAMTGHGFSLGYSKLVKSLLDVELDKHETRSDWLQRPLSASQHQYAAEDVHYLLPVYQRLVADAETLGRSHWLAEEMQNLLSAATQRTPDEQQYRRIKGAGRLDPRSLAILQVLAGWRETEARACNKPRGHIVADKEFLEIAQQQPDDISALKQLEDVRHRVVRQYGDKLLALSASVSDNSETYPEAFPQPPSKEVRQLIKDFREWLNNAAEARQMAPEILAKRVALESLARSKEAGTVELPTALAQGWRREAVGSDLLSFVEQAG
ncbi:MAG: ribonuclease D [Porticoccaceae bacterium]